MASLLLAALFSVWLNSPNDVMPNSRAVSPPALPPFSETAPFDALPEPPSESAARATAIQGLTLPTPIPGSPEYLVRCLYLMPTDRQPADPGAMQAQVSEATQRIRAAMEAYSDYMEHETRVWLGITPGARPNLERETDGEVRVIPVLGRLPTSGSTGYWGDDEGLFAHGWVWWRSLEDIWGNDDQVNAATRKTVFIIFADVLTIDDSTNPPTWRGYIGAGGNRGDCSEGQGGITVVTYGAFSFLSLPPAPGEDARIATMRSDLCDSEETFTIGGYTGGTWGYPPRGAAQEFLNRTENISLFMGILGHEGGHAFGLGHDQITHNANTGIMGVGYSRAGAVLRTIYGVDCPAIPLTSEPWCPPGELGATFADRLIHSPYFQTAVNPDKTDPVIHITWPPMGYFREADLSQTYGTLPFRASATDSGGMGLNSLIIYYDGWSQDYTFFSSKSKAEVTFTEHSYNALNGMQRFFLQAADAAGNAGSWTQAAGGEIFTSDVMDTVYWKTHWVRRPAGEDPRPRDASKPKGSFKNPYDSIPEAINAALPVENSTVLIGRGVWPVSIPLEANRGISITGEGVGQTILDGGGSAEAIFLDKDGASMFEECVYSNLVLRNAKRGIQKTASAYSYNYAVTNCIFYNLSNSAVDMNWHSGQVEFSGLTVYGCGAGIRIYSWSPITNKDHFVFHNNLVANCAGTGISLDNIRGLRSSLYAGGNLSYGNGTNWAGNGESASTPSYASSRLPGEISKNPAFVKVPPTAPEDLKPGSESPALRAGLAPYENENGSRRDIGAWISQPFVPASARLIHY